MPDERDEAIRDLSRAREDAVAARLRARQQLKAMLLRHGRAYHGRVPGPRRTSDTWPHVSFDHPAQQIAFDEYRQAVKDAHERVERLTQALREQCEHWRMRAVVKALMCLRGIDFIAAVTLIAELGDLSRFAHPQGPDGLSRLGPLGVLLRQHSPPRTITKAGNKHARRILVEAAWTYRFNPRVSRPIEVRQEGQPKAIRDIAWKAQLRLTYRFRKLNAGTQDDSEQVLCGDRSRARGFHLGYRPARENPHSELIFFMTGWPWR